MLTLWLVYLMVDRTALDEKAVERYLTEHIPGFKLGAIHQFSFGQS